MVASGEQLVGASPHVVFAGGGTGGHLFPALAVCEALTEAIPDVCVTFFGTHRAIDARIIGETSHELVCQELPGVSSRPWRWPRALLCYRRAIRHSRSRMTLERPGVVVGTGGLGSVPPILGARRLGIPTAIINPDVVPGRANRFLAGRVDMVFVPSDEVRHHLSRSAQVLDTGCPVRRGVCAASRDEGLSHFKLDARRKTLLVTGASQGARSINQAVLANAEWLAKQTDWQVLHLTGDVDHAEVARVHERYGLAGAVVAFTQEMPLALACADLAVTRGGASTLAELAVAGVPSIVFPYPFHKDCHQEHNARLLVSHGAARLITDRIDAAANGPALEQVLRELMNDESKRLAMVEAARRAARPDAARAVVAHLLPFLASAESSRPTESLEVSC